ncbi:microtubule-associated protein futsch isoform X2 [Culex quinquefasciatus]|nr:microtubule-associated protein futsch isoform X2 [Culex quinquefasciatus]
MTTGTAGQLPGHEQYEKVRKALQGANRSQIDKALEQLVKTCQTATRPDAAAEKVKIDDDQLSFWLNDVLRLLFDWENALTRDLALKASEAISAHLSQTTYLESAAWPALRQQISTTYSNLLEQARGRNDPEWHRKWEVMVRILDKEICQGAAIINAYLAIVESGFRSAELQVREQSFDCWKVLTFIFAKYSQINSPKRVKLICIPLKSSKSKTEMIARRKFEIWWFMVNQLGEELEKFADAVFEPFIYFCFGPSFKTPLCYYFDDSYQEYGTPGKFFDSIKQLSAIALIHMLGPADKVTESLLQQSNGCAASFNLLIPLKPIPARLVSEKLKLLFNSCLECTVLLAQMKDKPYLELNRNLWRNLLARVECEESVTKPEMLAWMQENLSALVKLSILRRDDAMREITFDTVRMVAETNLMAVTIGQDSPEQLTNNYKLMMPLLLNAELLFPPETSRTILSHWFDLRRYTSTPRGYWDLLQKTVQYLADLDAKLFGDARYRWIVTQIYRTMAPLLREQINKCPRGGDQFEQNFLPVALGFLLFPLEYDRFVQVGELREEWQAVYGAVVAAGQKGSTRFACAFSEMIKAMIVAKYGANLGVILEYFRVVLESVPGDFDMAHPPIKTLEVFKDLMRKGVVLQESLIEVAKSIAEFRRLLERMSNRGLLAVIMPIRNVVSEMISVERETIAEEVRSTFKLLADRFVTAKFVTDVRSQPKEVKWNCKMLVGLFLELPVAMQKQWKVGELRKLVDVCEGKETPGKPAKNSKKEEFVVINKVWNFTPDKLTEHQRDRMREKRDDIPALYNDMSQSQDSFVIKPWTPNKMAQSNAKNDTDASSAAMNGEAQQEASVPKEEGSTGVTTTTTTEKIDKENNNGNVPNGRDGDEKEGEGSGTTGKKATTTGDKRSRVARELDRLKIDAIEGQNLQAGRLARTRRSESLEPSGPPTRRKAVEPKKRELTQSASRRSTRKSLGPIKQESAPELTASSTQETSPKKERPKSPAEPRTSPRKSLNFDNVVDREPAAATEAPSTSSPVKAKASNESIDEVIESSQASPGAAAPPTRKFTPRKPKEEQDVVMARETPPPATEEALQSPSKNLRSSAQKLAEMDTEPNTEIPETQTQMEVVEETPKVSSKSPKKEVSPARATRSPRKEPVVEEEVKKSASPARAAKSPKKRSLSPAAPEPMEVVPESPEKPKEEAALVSPNLSPIRDNLDEQMEPLAKALNRSLVSSPDGAGQDEREADLLNSTLNISPIPEEKHQPSTPSASSGGAAVSQPTSGSGEKRASSRIMDREKAVMPSPTVTRRTRNSPPVIPAAVANLKARAATTPQMTPRSPSANRIELRGRGAQLINLIRNQQHEGSPKPSTPVPNTSTPKQGPSTPSDRSLMLRKLATSGASATATTVAQSPEQPKPLLEKEKEKDYLVFTKVLPSPQASPAASILKRKYNHDDSGDDESPANKRKRVSFHDPPVSITKEYIRQEEELGRSPSIIRCLQMSSGSGGMSPSDKAKFLLRRKSKADSMVELAKFTKVEEAPAAEVAAKDDEEEIGSSPESLDGDFVINTTDQMEALHVTTDVPDDVDVEMKEADEPVPEPTPPTPAELPKRTSPRKISPKSEPAASPKKPTSPVPPPQPDTSLHFPSEDEVLTHVISTYSLDAILERYLSAGKTLQHPKTARLLTRELSTLMAKDAKTKHTVLDELSERHSAEFLDHAVQENSSAMVCARLSLTTMAEFVFEALRKEEQDQQEEERTRVLQTVFDQLTRIDQASGGGVEFAAMRDRFVRRVVHGKSKLEIVALLEEYFVVGSSRTEQAGSSGGST